jgi:hypothetical protein
MEIYTLISVVSLIVIVGSPLAVLWHSHRKPKSKTSTTLEPKAPHLLCWLLLIITQLS